jgi:3-hydroxybutyrate dehydrogenase
MDDQTALALALQLIALCCIGAALLLYLLCRIRSRYRACSGADDPEVTSNIGMGRAVLITSCDTAFGLQCALHLSNLGFRVFAGLKDANESGSLAGRILRAKFKERETTASESGVGTLITLPLDVTREDLLHEALVLIRRHLPAGEDGK